MSADLGNKTKTICALVAFALIAAVCLTFFARGRFGAGASSENVELFDGWIYGREDQQRASAALAQSGLNDFEWRDGKLSAPLKKRGAYLKALADAGAYPKAPSELRADAMRETSVFESETKTRLRELNACAAQLERTIEQMRGVEYATVGARARRETVGFSSRTIVTASVGVARRDDEALDRDALAAITLAAKHQLGIDDAKNVSVIDLKQGKSYCGIDAPRESEIDAELALEKRRIEKYWRETYLEAFSDVKNLRVSVAVELERGAAPSDEENAKSARDDEPNARESASEEERATGSFERIAQVAASTRPDKNYISARPAPLLDASENVPFERARVLGKFETLDQERQDEPPTFDDAQAPLDDDANLKDDFERTQANRNASPVAQNVGFARLGNPNSNRRSTRESSRARSTSERVVAPSPRAAFVKTSNRLVAEAAATDGAFSTDGRVALAAATLPARDADARRALAEKSPFVIRSIFVRIGVPRSCVRNASLRTLDETSSRETFARDDLENSMYLATEERILTETKRFAVELARPLAERLGWSEEKLDASVVVTVFSDLDAAPPATESDRAANGRRPFDKNGETSEHKSGYVVGESLEPKTDGKLVADFNGAVSEIAPTVAAEVADSEDAPDEVRVEETTRDDERMNALDSLRDFLKSERVRAYLRSPNARRAALGAVVLFVGALATRRAIKKRKQNDRESGTFEKVDASRRDLEKRDARDEAANERPSDRRASTRKSAFERAPINDEFDEFDEDDALDEELRRLEQVRAPQSKRDVGRDDDEYWSKRDQALKFVALYPEQAAESLQRWARTRERSTTPTISRDEE